MPQESSAKLDMIFEPILGGLSIFTDNLSIFYVICALISFIAVFFTWHNEPTNDNETKEDSADDTLSNEHISEDSDESTQSNLNPLAKKEMMKSFKKSLARVDRAKESEIEKQQLKDILNVMKKDEKYGCSTMEELEEQLRLYRD
ncbi:uncharacterized protein [Halyomorpha halys]|uniref:uncharacterized protein n=1 Tax=Halyomorpha halys TaxID=286706 RepID=UPI0006D508ED|nr:uncharacterized protein LOC106678438 [Halyomorpha halys]